MRLGVEQPRAQAPDGGEGVVVEAQAAARREHGDALAQRVERLPLHMDERVVAAFERQPLGDVLVEIGDAAVMSVGDDMQAAAVGQMPFVLRLCVGAVSGEPGAFPILIIGPLRQAPCLAQAVEDLAVTRRGGEVGRVELPQSDIGLVVMHEPLAGIEYGEGGGEAVEAAQLRLDGGRYLAALGRQPLHIQQGAQGGDFGIERAMFVGQAGEIETLPGEIAHFQHEAPAHRPAVSLDMAPPRHAQDQIEGRPLLGEAQKCLVQRLRRGPVEPILEAQQETRVARHSERRRQIGREQPRRRTHAVPGDKHLRLGAEHRIEHALGVAEAFGRAQCRGLRRAGRFPRPEAGNRRTDGKGDDAERDAEGEQDPRIHARRPRRHGLARQQETGGERQQEAKSPLPQTGR